jgi:hypothetical protein
MAPLSDAQSIIPGQVGRHETLPATAPENPLAAAIEAFSRPVHRRFTTIHND